MAYDLYLAERIDRILNERKVIFYQKKNDGRAGLHGR